MGDNTHLVGAALGRAADPSINLFSTRVTVEDLKNGAEFPFLLIGAIGSGSPSDAFNFHCQ